MDPETKGKVDTVKKDAEARVMDLVIKGMREKEARLQGEKQEAVDRELKKRNGWEATMWVEKVDTYQQKCRKEAEERKKKKIKVLTELRDGGEARHMEKLKVAQDAGRDLRRKEEEEEGEEERVESGKKAISEKRVVESWECLVEEEKVKEFGGKLYSKEESIESRMEEIKGVMEVFEENGLEAIRSPLDGNCFFHAVGQQTGMGQEEVRALAVKHLRESNRMNGEE